MFISDFIKKDLEDETEAIKIYSKRQKQIPHLSKMYKEMMNDEKDHQRLLRKQMPISEYYKGSGEKVMSSMKKRYGAKKGKQVFYATANSRDLAGPSKKMKHKKGMK